MVSAQICVRSPTRNSDCEAVEQHPLLKQDVVEAGIEHGRLDPVGGRAYYLLLLRKIDAPFAQSTVAGGWKLETVELRSTYLVFRGRGAWKMDGGWMSI